MRKTLIVLIGLFIVFLVSCGTNNEKSEIINDDESDLSSGQVNKDNELKSDEDVDNNGNNGENEKRRKTEIGIYNGQQDPHTIEIETAEGPTAFQLTEEAKLDVEKLTEGDEVIYTYYKDGEQLIIELIEEYWFHREHHGDEHHFDHMNEERYRNENYQFEQRHHNSDNHHRK